MTWVLDFEASGLDEASYPIEVGVVGDGGEYQALITPSGEWEFWDDISEEFHGITRSDLDISGQPVSLVAAKLNELLCDQVVFSDGVSWDQFWLTRLFDAAGIQPQFTLRQL